MENNQSFDSKKAHKLAKDYAQATGMECLLFTEDNKMINHCTNFFGEGFCYQKNPQVAHQCYSNHRYHSIKTRTDGKSSYYYCPLGLIHWSAPIVIDGRVRGALVGGHAFLRKARESLTELSYLTKEHQAIFAEYPALQKSLLGAPVVDENKLDSLINILTVLAISLSDDTYHEVINLNRQQAATPTGEVPSLWQQLADSIKADRIEQIDDLLMGVTMEIRSQKQPLAEIKAILTNILLDICNHFTDKMDDHYLTNHCLVSLQELEHIDDYEELAKWATSNIKNLLEEGRYLPVARHAEMIHNALAFIEQNYSKPISLADIANHVHFSAPYFSKIFKREMNITFTRYLTRVRIEESKKLLIDPTIPLAKIPSRVGFEEQSYFTKVFRANVGTSPGRYRDQLIASQNPSPLN